MSSKDHTATPSSTEKNTTRNREQKREENWSKKLEHFSNLTPASDEKVNCTEIIEIHLEDVAMLSYERSRVLHHEVLLGTSFAKMKPPPTGTRC